MPTPTNRDLIECWRNEPAPLLPLLHAFHDREGFISEEALRDIAVGLRTSLADLFGTVTFYHHFSRTPPGQSAPRVCTGPVCCLVGGNELLAALKAEGATPMPCAGRCDDFVPVLKGHQVLIGVDPDALEAKPSPLPPPNPGGIDECVFGSIREPDRSSIEGYRRTGGYEGLTRAVREMRPAEVVEVITDSKLAGRGGAGFPTGLKWQGVSEAPSNPKTIVCNADEGEPGCFKDRAILDHDPHAVIEAMVLAAYATGATRGFIYLRYEYPETLDTLARAIGEAEEAGFLGERILDADFSFHIHLRRGAGAYICGEEGSLLNSLEGKHPFPRNRPSLPCDPRLRQLANGCQQRGNARGCAADYAPGGGLVSQSWNERSRGHEGHQPFRGHPETGQLRGAVWIAVADAALRLGRRCTGRPFDSSGHDGGSLRRLSRWRGSECNP